MNNLNNNEVLGDQYSSDNSELQSDTILSQENENEEKTFDGYMNENIKEENLQAEEKDKLQDVISNKDVFPVENKNDILFQEIYDEEEDFIRESLKRQVKAEMQELSVASENNITGKEEPGKVLKKVLLVSGICLMVLLMVTGWLLGTRSGRRIIYHIAGGYIIKNTDKDNHVSASSDIKEEIGVKEKNTNEPIEKDKVSVESSIPAPEPRSEDYVSNYLIFGVEEIDHAKNTDTIMLASINRRDQSIKLTSLLRDIYIDAGVNKQSKINAVYAATDAVGLVNTIETNFRIKIDGYAYINFEAFESIIDYLGGISIELGEEEAHYLNTTNYISNKANRNVKPGRNILNGNQALGYCRVRKCVTLGGANDDYGRTLRQRRVLNAIFNQYKSKNILKLLSIMDNCLGYVKTDLTHAQVEQILEDIIENKITTMNTLRVPANGAFETPKEWNGIDDPLVLNWEANIKELYQFIFLDTEEEAMKAME